jgi:Mg2+-importing ATPase
VIFVIRTRGNPLRSRPHRWLIATSLGVVGCAVAIPYTAIGEWFGFVPPPPGFLAAVAGMVLCYLVLAEGVKRWFYSRWPPRGVRRAPVLRAHLPFLGRH